MNLASSAEGPTVCDTTPVNQNTNSHSNSREAEIMSCLQNDQSLRETDSNSEFNRLSEKLNQKMTQ